MDVIPFGAKDVDNILQREPHRAESLAFGAILLDRTGKIVKYNQAEGLIAGRAPNDVMGRNFFNDIAPCAKGETLSRRVPEVHADRADPLDARLRVRLQDEAHESAHPSEEHARRPELLAIRQTGLRRRGLR